MHLCVCAHIYGMWSMYWCYVHCERMMQLSSERQELLVKDEEDKERKSENL